MLSRYVGMYILSILVFMLVCVLMVAGDEWEYGEFDLVNPLWSGCKWRHVSMRENWVVSSVSSWFPVLPVVNCPPM